MIAYSHIRPHYATWSHIIRASPQTGVTAQPWLIERERQRFSGVFDFSPCYQGKGTSVGCHQTNLAHGIPPDRSELIEQGDSHGPSVERLPPTELKGGRRLGPPKARGVQGIRG